MKIGDVHRILEDDSSLADHHYNLDAGKSTKLF